MKTFRVWARALGGASRLRVEGPSNSRWLLDQLSRSFVFKDSQPMVEERASSCCTFHIPHGQQLSSASLERLLRAIPEVEFLLEPA
jgi:hypothetical protein